MRAIFRFVRHRLNPEVAGLLLAFALAMAVKAIPVITDRVPFNADEAIVALMARHILQGERPVFFYGQTYMGSLDAFLVAGGFAIFGQQIWVIRLVQAVLYLGTLWTTYLLGKAIFGSPRSGMIAVLLLAVPVVNVALYTTVSLGGYGEALLLGNLILLCALRIANYSFYFSADIQTTHVNAAPSTFSIMIPVFLWSVFAGLGLWALAITLVYTLPAAGLIIVRYWQNRTHIPWRLLIRLIFLGLVGFAIGAFPLWNYALHHGIAELLFETGGGAVNISQSPYFEQVIGRLLNFVLLGGTATLGLRPPWEVRWLALPLIPFILLFWAAVINLTARKLRRLGRPERQFSWMLIAMIGVLAAAFILTPFGNDPSGRYFLPLALPLALFAGDAIRTYPFPKEIWRWAVVVFVMAFNGIGIIQCALRLPPGITTQFDLNTVVDHRYDQQLIDFLDTQGETRGFSNYWVAYPLAFLSQERLIFVPRLPYHLDLSYTPRDDRYAPYDQIVKSSSKVAYITINRGSLDSYLRSAFSRAGVQWDEKLIGDYRIYYHLSKSIQPEEIGLGLATP
jgi:4-amino-4-deoxy-L-arabinose transferase-like glycosyltransferase